MLKRTAINILGREFEITTHENSEFGMPVFIKRCGICKKEKNYIGICYEEIETLINTVNYTQYLSGWGTLSTKKHKFVCSGKCLQKVLNKISEKEKCFILASNL